MCGPQQYTKYTKIHKFTTNSKNPKFIKYELWNLYIIQNKNVFLFYFPCFFFENSPNVRKYFGIVGVFCIINRYFEYRIRIRCI